MLAGSSYRPRFTVEGVDAFDSVSASAIKKNGKGSDLAGSLLSGSASVNKNVITMEIITALSTDGGNVYIVLINAVLDGNPKKFRGQFNIVDPYDPIIAPFNA